MPRDRRFPRRLPLLPLVFTAITLLVVGGGAWAGVKLLSTPPPPHLRLGLPASLALAPGTAPAIPVPGSGSFDLVSDASGSLASLSPGSVWPIGSVAKVMTALVVLQKKPLTGAADPGPTYTITRADVSLYRQVVAEDGSNLFVSTGEQLTERQLLLALLLPSANNIAETLAIWVDGSLNAFVADLNAKAKTLGMAQTHFADTSGYSPGTVSTAADLVTLGQAALANPVLAGLVATKSAVMPDGTTVQNLDTDLGSVPGWLGIKTGSTPQAGGCLLFAAEHPGPLGGPATVRVVGAILGQTLPGGNLNNELATALSGAASAVDAAFQAYTTVDPSKLGAPSLSGAVSSPWGSSAGLQASFQSAMAPVEVRVGAALSLSGVAVPHLDSSAIQAGTVVAHLTGKLGGSTVATWSVAATGGLGEPSWDWLLTH